MEIIRTVSHLYRCTYMWQLLKLNMNVLFLIAFKNDSILSDLMPLLEGRHCLSVSQNCNKNNSYDHFMICELYG